MNYNWKYMNEQTLEEMDKLLDGEHADTLTAWSYECGNAAVTGFKRGLVKASLLGAGCVALTAGVIQIGVKMHKKYKKKKEAKKKEV